MATPIAALPTAMPPVTEPHRLPASSYEETWNLFRVYNGYRFLLSIVLLLMYFGQWDSKLLGSLFPQLYLGTAATYCLFSLLSLLVLGLHATAVNTVQLFVTVAVDFTVLALLTIASGSLETGISTLMIVSVAVGSLFFTGSLSLLVAAFATLTVLGTTIYLSTLTGRDDKDFIQAAVLGILFFAMAWGFRSLAERIRRSQRLADAQSQSIAQLERINEMIVQRMRTGVIVVADNEQQIRLMNRAAAELLGLPPQMRRLPGDLTIPLQRWQHFHEDQPRPFRARRQGPELQVRFSSLDYGDNRDTLIFIEDTRRIAQQAQQMKLASLGRLTASIAHEIRNPLGAISHAAQLLEESPSLDPQDRRLLDIVHHHTRRMNGIVENVLQLSRRQLPQPQRFDLAEWLPRFSDAFHNSQPHLPRPRLNLPTALEITFDPSQLEQVLSNLCENGLRHSAADTGQARVTLQALTDEHTGQPMLDILNPGNAIPAAQASQFFEPFFTTGEDGTGLGLYISRELCEFNQASLDYLPSDDGITRFRIRFAHPERRIALDLDHGN